MLNTKRKVLLNERESHRGDTLHWSNKAKILQRENALQASLIDDLVKKKTKVKKSICLANVGSHHHVGPSSSLLSTLLPLNEINRLKRKINISTERARLRKKHCDLTKARDLIDPVVYSS
ncbi:hypothetical protein HAX54_026040 [Datura stramonium]|uniref:Uncharacterized protein n=1 Tax=Datura stramonium TaxID=4076 RepID=A0ABS8V0I3_DATST|nr:hypothetical protein [Datura stramonium]